MIVRFTVYGKPQPQGSTRAFLPKGAKRPIITSDNKKLMPWRQEFSRCAIEAMRGKKMVERPAGVRLDLGFYFSRPKSLAKRYTENSKRPDASKTLRAAEDAMTGIVYEDDAQVNDIRVRKLYGQPERTEVTVFSANGATAESALDNLGDIE